MTKTKVLKFWRLHWRSVSVLTGEDLKDICHLSLLPGQLDNMSRATCDLCAMEWAAIFETVPRYCGKIMDSLYKLLMVNMYGTRSCTNWQCKAGELIRKKFLSQRHVSHNRSYKKAPRIKSESSWRRCEAESKPGGLVLYDCSALGSELFTYFPRYSLRYIVGVELRGGWGV